MCLILQISFRSNTIFWRILYILNFMLYHVYHRLDKMNLRTYCQDSPFLTLCRILEVLYVKYSGRTHCYALPCYQNDSMKILYIHNPERESNPQPLSKQPTFLWLFFIALHFICFLDFPY